VTLPNWLVVAATVTFLIGYRVAVAPRGVQPPAMGVRLAGGILAGAIAGAALGLLIMLGYSPIDLQSVFIRLSPDLLEFLARALVADPSAVQVTEVEEIEGEVVLELEVAEDDLGRVIGRGGRVANALRAVMKAAATREDKRVVVDILD